MNSTGDHRSLVGVRVVDLSRALAGPYATMMLAGVLGENYRPGLLARLGLDPVTLRETNPWLVTLSARERTATGRGRAVETRLVAAVTAVHAFHGAGGLEPRRTGNRHPAIAPYRDRVGVAAALRTGIDDLPAGRKADDVLADLVAAGVPAGRIRSILAVSDWEQVRHLGLVHRLARRTLGEVSVPGGALGYDGAAATSTVAPPLLGEHDLNSASPWLEGVGR